MGKPHVKCTLRGRGGMEVSQMQTAAERRGGGLVKGVCPHFERFSRFVFEIAQAGNCLCN